MPSRESSVGVIIVNNQGNEVIEMGGDLPRLTIPAVFVGQSDGETIKDATAEGGTDEPAVWSNGSVGPGWFRTQGFDQSVRRGAGHRRLGREIQFQQIAFSPDR